MRLAAPGKVSEVALKITRRCIYLIVKGSVSTEKGARYLHIQRAHAQRMLNVRMLPSLEKLN